jgi:hypothetical protein
VTWADKKLGLKGCAVGALVGFLTVKARHEVQAYGGLRPLIMHRASWLMTTEWFQPPEIMPPEQDPELTAPPSPDPPDPFAAPKEPEGTE